MMKQLISILQCLLITGLFINSAYAEPAKVSTDIAIKESSIANPYTAPGSFIALNYHETRDDVRDYPDPYAVDSSALVMQFSWLKGNGYTPVSLSQIIAARQGGKPLPPRAVLLTFDDAYLSFYTRVYPLLKEFHYPAVLAVVGKWIENPKDGPMMYGEKGSVSSASFPTWKQLREMADSGLVELASHTYDLHHGILANPQNNMEPAATARLYDAATNTYEADSSWHERVRADLANNSNVIASNTGYRPRAIVWPYGSYNHELVSIAGDLGMPITMTLDDGANTEAVPLNLMRRTLIEHNPTLAEFAIEVRGPINPRPIRVVQVNLDDIYNTDTVRQEQNLSALLNRIQILKLTHVFLQATTASHADGIVDTAYFPNQSLALRADLFNRVAWQLATRDDVKVFAVMPLADFNLPADKVLQIYEDLARNASIDGLVFDDRRQAASLEESEIAVLTQKLALIVKKFRAPIQTVRAVHSPDNVAALANIGSNYDYLALFYSPKCESALLSQCSAMFNLEAGKDLALRQKLIFMFYNNTKSSTAMLEQMRMLQINKLFNFGYATDDFLHQQPSLKQLAPVMSLREYPMAHGSNNSLEIK